MIVNAIHTACTCCGTPMVVSQEDVDHGVRLERVRCLSCGPPPKKFKDDPNNLIPHAYEACDDPDCELHNPDVAVEEGVIGPTEVAYYMAGYRAGMVGRGTGDLERVVAARES